MPIVVAAAAAAAAKASAAGATAAAAFGPECNEMDCLLQAQGRNGSPEGIGCLLQQQQQQEQQQQAAAGCDLENQETVPDEGTGVAVAANRRGVYTLYTSEKGPVGIAARVCRWGPLPSRSPIPS